MRLLVLGFDCRVEAEAGVESGDRLTAPAPATGAGQRLRPPAPTTGSTPPRALRPLALPANLIVGPRT